MERKSTAFFNKNKKLKNIFEKMYQMSKIIFNFAAKRTFE
jgi:hypothetical protein